MFTIEPMPCNQTGNDLLAHILRVFHGVDDRDEIIDDHRSLAQPTEPQRDHALPVWDECRRLLESIRRLRAA